jgi:hypothetical protein
MNAINMPGFTAEASLYRNSAHYQVGTMLAGLRQGGEVVPALIWDCEGGICCFCTPNLCCCCSQISCNCW